MWVSIESLYNFKNSLQRQICSMWLSRFLSHCISGTLLMHKILLNERHTKWLLERRHSGYHWFIETKSDVQTRRNFRTNNKYGRDPPSRPSTRAWDKKFMETATVFDKGRTVRPRTSEENVDRVRNRVPSWCDRIEAEKTWIHTSHFAIISTYLSFHLPLW